MKFFRLLKFKILHISLLVAVLLLSGIPVHAQPAGFVDEVYLNNFNLAIGLTFDDNGTMYAWEKRGHVYIVDNGVKQSTPFIDIEEEVGNWGDFGLMSVALDPNYLSNGYIYLMYVVDRHHLLYHGTGAYNANANVFFDATIGRITRYTVNNPGNPATASVNYNSRLILLGQAEADGIPILHKSHGPGSMVFGSDETLIITTGDGASFSGMDVGYSSNNTQYPPTGLDDDGDAIIPNSHDVGAYRSQIIGSLNGKILRIDKTTGEGLPSNPFWTGDGDDVESKVWAYGLRNPFRATVRPNTGSFNPSEGNPGTIYLGDVGWNKWEELNICTAGGQNFGWPAYQGPQQDDQYYQNAPGSINLTQIDNNNRMPTFSYKHAIERTVVFQNGNQLEVGSGAGEFAGDDAEGNSSTGGVWYNGLGFPEEYDDTYFHGDYASLIVQNYTFDANDEPLTVNDFVEGATKPGAVVCLASNPQVDGLFYVKYSPNEIRRIYYSPGNYPPTAVAVADKYSGAKPLEVNFVGDQSSDPDGDPLTYTWKVDGATFSTSANPTYTFNPSTNDPKEYTVTLEVNDGNATRSTDISISVNNTAPQIVSTGIEGVNIYSVTDINGTTLNLNANATDAEHSNNELTYAWDVALHHNTHNHPEPTNYNQADQVVLAPTDCDDAVYWYRVQLTVTDPVGASAYYRKDIYPDCPGGNTDPIADFSRNPSSGNGPLTVTFDATASSDPDVDGQISDWIWDFGDGNTGFGETVTHTFFSGGTFNVSLTVKDDLGDQISETKTVTVTGGTNNAPSADIVATPTTGQSPLQVGFDGTGSTDSDGSIVSYSWDFGDGNSATGATANHTYNVDGTYLATLTVTDDQGASGSANVTITVTAGPVNNPPVAAFTPSTTAANLPVLISFDASASTDSDGTIVSYAWDFGDGNTGTGINATNIYNTAGTFTASLTVTDDGGATGTTTETIVITDPNITEYTYDAIEDAYVKASDPNTNYGTDATMRLKDNGNFSHYSFIKFNASQFASLQSATLRMYPASGTKIIIVSASGTSDTWSETTITAGNAPAATTGVLGSFTMANDADPIDIDVTTYASSILASGSTIAFRITSSNGNKDVGLIDAKEGGNPAQLIVNTNPPPNTPPTAAFVATPTTGVYPLLVSFDASGTSDTDGIIASYTWDFGDGNTGSGVNASHTYTTNGTFTAQLIATDDDGDSDTVTTNIVVDIPNALPIALISTDTTAGDYPLPVAFDGSASYDPDGSIVS